MSILIPDMKMPPKGKRLFVAVNGCGDVYLITSGAEIITKYQPSVKAVELPPHGRLIDADEMERFMSDGVQGDIRDYPYGDETWGEAFRWMDNRPTIIQADDCKEANDG